MSKDNAEGYKVGYRKPPVGSRFKKGQSGNPRGRPKKNTQVFHPGRILQSIDNEELVVNIDGKRKRMPRAEIHLRQLFNKAMRGDIDAARIIATMAKQHFGPDAEGPSEIEFVVVPERSELTAKNPMSEESNERAN
ncbi:DUF5681 domain-containing protein [Bradyrhizobium sp. 2S1]|uniref:DUF5681 domain-containing protein n=1 Tax=Bradyrhizobium sp. 2S1 TaxID=1404429 RepID=UPI00140BE925|nr:DUF5681 domain-containing protein [Bradyrhizobium sp. 2S1]MCK7670945.1 DUF5681 domain-containing protein [Bradyrhizobium sp. 2S1]